MKIRRKPPKLARHGHPLYVIGYSSPAPQLAEVQAWFDLEYGGPIKFKEEATSPSALVLAIHGPWNAAIQIGLPSAETDSWKERLGWGHSQAGLVLPASAATSKAADLILHASRLARGLTLLTDGTAYDVITHEYLNPSDWKDRPLNHFRTADHIVVGHVESGDSGLERFYTGGLTKFGLDELETLRPVGLPSRPILDSLADIAGEILLVGHSPRVGSTLEMPGLGIAVQVMKHRTTVPSEGSVPVREIVWDELAGKD